MQPHIQTAVASSYFSRRWRIGDAQIQFLPAAWYQNSLHDPVVAYMPGQRHNRVGTLPVNVNEKVSRALMNF